MLSNNTYYNSKLNTLPSPPQQQVVKSKMSTEQHKYCCAMIRNLKKHRDASPFLKAVDYIKLNVPDYPNIVKKPMDLLLVDSKLNSFQYMTVEEFIFDVRLIFNNCFKYNGPEAMISVLCQNVESAFEKGLRQMPINNNINNNELLLSPPISPLSSIDLCSEDLGRPKREIHCPSKDYPETFTKQNKLSLTNKGEMKYCLQVLNELKKNKYRNQMYPFMLPVDPIALNLPDYTTIIKQPMDLSTIENNLLNNQYNSPNQFQQDVLLMFNNCFLYNPPSLPIYSMAEQMEKVFKEKWESLSSFSTTSATTVTTIKKKKKIIAATAATATIATAATTTTTTTTTTTNNNNNNKNNTKNNTKNNKNNMIKNNNKDNMNNNVIKKIKVDQEIAKLEKSILNISKQIQSMKSKKSTPKKPLLVKKRKQSINSNTILHEFTFNQKKALSHEINELDSNRLNAVVDIIKNSMPDLGINDQKEIELDIDSLDNITLHQLYNAIHPKKISNGKKQKIHHSDNNTDLQPITTHQQDSSDSSSSSEEDEGDDSDSSSSDSDSD